MRTRDPAPTGAIVIEDGLEWFRIDDVDGLDPFLVSLTSSSNHWTFVSSSGALTAGRRHAERALLPYETDDRLHRAGGRSGPVTVLRVGEATWEPFAAFTPPVPGGPRSRSLAKTLVGDRLRGEERAADLGLVFRWTLATSHEHGLVRTCELARDAEARGAVEVEVLDGLRDVLPAGVPLGLQQSASTLVDAYRRSELDPVTGAALFSLEAAITDGADPAESLRANLVWSRGLPDPVVALHDRGLDAARAGRPLAPQHLATGVKGAFLQAATVRLGPGERVTWTTVGDVHLDHADVAARLRWLREAHDPLAEVTAAVDRGHQDLLALVAEQDGLQRTGDRRADGHHLANTLFNAMRGGALREDHRIHVGRFLDGAAVRNAGVAASAAWLGEKLPAEVEVDELRAAVADHPQLARLADEHLPLTFSRRHGDPSRPWNRFDIEVRDRDGAAVTAYEGNWRDIFQNWEAMLHSFPAYLPSVVAKFLNASTRDGHNPYRIDHRGIDWEVPEAGDWAHFGYWGDHQLVYLLRLLEAHERFRPGELAEGLDRVRHSHADVPYRLLPYEQIVQEPKHTMTFDEQRQARTERRCEELGTDGRLVPAADGGVALASLAEKLLIPALAKLSNLVPGGGVWMNTQRPEWNDANNALVGNGVSVVTAFHLHDHLGFLAELLATTPHTTVPLDPAVRDWVLALTAAMDDHAELIDPAAITPHSRRSLLDRLGAAYEAYRDVVYDTPPGAPVQVSVTQLARSVDVARAHVAAVVTGAGHEPDLAAGHVASYRLLVLGDATAELLPLPEMLEGQVAALSTRGLDPDEVVARVDALFAGPLLRPDHGTFLLYPARQLPAFTERNVVPDALVVPPLADEVDARHGLLRRDVDGRVRFGGDHRNAGEVAAALDAASVAPAARAAVLAAWEAVFDHHSFTGRSGTMHRYEGIGSIYWHMVVKLLLAVQERVHEAERAGADEARVAALIARYRRVRDGLGHRGSVARYGAFPLDPHSHSPAHTGAQQPGMTGATKEGVLVRLGELGVRVADGLVEFDPVLLSSEDLLDEPTPWTPLGADGVLAPGTLGFTFCGVPVVYRGTDEQPRVRVHRADGTITTTTGTCPGVDASRELFARRGTITRVEVEVADLGGRNH